MDRGNTRVQKFDSLGNYVLQFGTGGGGPGQFSLPFGIAVNSTSGAVYVSDLNNNNVQQFTTLGGYVTGWGGPAPVTDYGQFNQPGGLALDGSGNLYVADVYNNRVEIFDSSNNFVTQIGSSAPATGAGNGAFQYPYGVAVDSSGNLFVMDTDNNRVQKFNASHGYVGQWGSAGSGAGQFAQSDGIAVDPSGNVYVADTYNNRIQEFDNSGNFITMWGSAGVGGNEHFEQPMALVVNSSGTTILVSDTNFSYIQTYGP